MKHNNKAWPYQFVLFNVALFFVEVCLSFSGLWVPVSQFIFPQVGLFGCGLFGLHFEKLDFSSQKKSLLGWYTFLSFFSVAAFHAGEVERLVVLFLPLLLIFFIKRINQSFSWVGTFRSYIHYWQYNKGWRLYVAALALRMAVALVVIGCCWMLGVVELIGFYGIFAHIIPMTVLGLVASCGFIIFDVLCVDEPTQHEFCLFNMIPIIYSVWSVMSIFCFVPDLSAPIAVLACTFYYQKHEHAAQDFLYQIVSAQILFLSLIGIKSTPLIQVLLCASQVIFNRLVIPWERDQGYQIKGNSRYKSARTIYKEYRNTPQKDRYKIFSSLRSNQPSR